MNRPLYTLGALTTVGVLAVAGLGLYFNQPGVGAQGTPSPTSTPSPTETPRAVDSDRDLESGRYIVHPLPAPNDSLAVTFTVPGGWTWFGNSLIPTGPPGTGGPGGIALQFIDVTSINPDPCHWSGEDDDVSAGKTVDDLVQALAQPGYEVSTPVDVSIGGYSGTRVDYLAPTEPFRGTSSEAPTCDERVLRLWSTTAHGPRNIYLQGPSNRWQTHVLDVDGTRLVVVVQDYPGTTTANRAELDVIVDSLVVEP